MKKRTTLTPEASKRRAKRRDIIFIICMLLPAVGLTLWQTYYPTFRGIIMAFQNYNLNNLNNIHWVGFDNFVALLKPGPFNSFYKTLGNTVIYVFGSLIPQLVIGFALALLMQKKFKGRGIYQGIVFIPWALSGFLVGIMWRWMFNGSGGVINDFLMRLGVIADPVGWLSEKSTAMFATIVSNVWYGVPFFTIMITAALQSVPHDLYEAASVDGANAFVKFRVITIPHIKSVLVLTTLLRVIWIFGNADHIKAMTNGGPAGSTEIITSYMFKVISTELNYGKAGALGILCMLIMAVYTLIYLRVTKFTSEE